MLTPETYALLGSAALLAGFIDAIAGGGGLITVPALLAAGLPPVNALATNKLQSVFGSGTSCWRFARRGLVEFRSYWPTALVVFAAALVGAYAVQHISADALKKAIPLLVIAAMAYMLLSPRMSDAEAEPRLSRAGYAPIGAAIGAYDGFFGPGTGSFFTTSLVGLRGMGLIRAAAHTKLFNFSSNAASVILFVAAGQAIWALGLLMAACTMAGAWMGAHVAMTHGARVIRPLLITVSLALTAKLIWDNFLGS
ncbi:MAG: TSUP family transporter [Sphingobium sp.]|nr:TSUP family transporter [Sphingobium sp.]